MSTTMTAGTAAYATATAASTATATAASTAVRLRTGDVIEIEIAGELTSALVLLASGDAVILDACDGSTPFVVRLSDLGDVRVFDPRRA